MPVRRTTLRNPTGMKIYAGRDAKRRIKNIPTTKRAHGLDLKRRGKFEKKEP